uniref:Uncharacterized protein n=1 Tax=Rhizophora mucronata TaxID=61149 RepID=A0A2P2IWZ2_RHIMU
MRFFLKTWSRSVHDEGHHQQQHQGPEINTDGTSTSLTVWRKSLITSCNGFTVFNSKGDLAYRVDSYIDRPEELTLMDCSGKPIFTIHRRKVIKWQILFLFSASIITHEFFLMFNIVRCRQLNLCFSQMSYFCNLNM